MMELSKKLKHYRLSKTEHEKICELLGREPKGVEWALFSALWSEHCSYKSSKVHLKKFAKTLTDKVVNASGENAGIIDLGEDEKVAFKMESHNHPSFIEPYQGAATGVGGILRDIFTMGARPIALADYLCFGEITAPRMTTLMDGVVRGIGGYGNCVGVPTVTGHTEFHSSYNNNILVNAMAVGLLTKEDSVALSGAKGPGNLVVYVGAKTGRDGVHGAAMASESFGQDIESKKPNIQIGDPFFEKLLIESCLEVIREKLVVAIQDMGAAGLTSSSFEMSSKGGVGLEMHLDQVPTRDSSISPEEILLSESQERMLLICEPQKFSQIQKAFEKWGLDAVSVGKVIPEKKVKLYFKGELLTEIDPDLLVENAPVYERGFYEWNFPRRKAQLEKTFKKEDFTQYVETLKTNPQFWKKAELYRQYDQRVGARTARDCDSDVAVVQLPSQRALSVSVGCRPHVVRADAYLGGLDAVVYPTLQMAVKGFTAQAVTDCLNFGNPENPQIMSEFVASVHGIRDASIVFETPVISGNVSFYNETQGKNISSTPATGLVGLKQNLQNIPQDHFQIKGSDIYLITCRQATLTDDTEWTGQEKALDLNVLRKLQKDLIALVEKEKILSSQVVGRGGLFTTLLKMTARGMGCALSQEFTHDELLKENFYQIILEVPSSVNVIFPKTEGVEFQKIGCVSGIGLQLSNKDHFTYDNVMGELHWESLCAR